MRQMLVAAFIAGMVHAASANTTPGLGELCLNAAKPEAMETACETLIADPAELMRSRLSQAQVLYQRAAARNRVAVRVAAKLEQSLADLEMLQRKHGPHQLLSQERGRALAHLLRMDEAEAAYARAEELGADDPRIPAHQRAYYWGARSATAFLRGRFDEALRHADRSNAIPHDGKQITVFRLTILNALKRHREAETGATAHLKLKPKDVDAYLVRAEAYRAMGMYPLARRDLDTVERLDPDNPYLAEKRALLK